MSTIAKRYASALVELARESDLIETFHEQFQTLHHIIEASSLEDFLSAPQISGSEKKALIDEASMMSDVQKEIVDVAMLASEKLLKNVVDAKADEALLEAYVKDVLKS